MIVETAAFRTGRLIHRRGEMGMLELVEKLRTDQPLVHNITNVVVTNFTANGLLAPQQSC